MPTAVPHSQVPHVPVHGHEHVAELIYPAAPHFSNHTWVEAHIVGFTTLWAFRETVGHEVMK